MFGRRGFPVMRYAKREDRTDKGCIWFAVNPDRMFPAILSHIERAMKRGRSWATRGLEPRSAMAVGTLLASALALPPNSWGLARKLPEEVGADRMHRARALEVARLWFTELLHAEIGYRKLGVHILKGSGRWRL